MSKLFNELKEKVQGKNKKIVFPEGEDIRILEAVVRLAKEGLVVPILIGEAEKLQAKAKSLGLSLDGIQILHHSTDKNFSEKVAEFVACRKGKATEEQAQELLKDENYYGTMLVHMKEADGLVSGAIHSTGDTVRPALQIIKTKPGVSKVAGVFVMEKGDTRYIFGDCAITIHPNAEDLAGIAVGCAETAEKFGIDPKIAMLSFSTNGSARSEETEKVVKATQLARQMAPDLILEGELQFDAAIVPSVAKQKMPDGKIMGEANVFVFPTLDAGNIGYKIAQRLGGFDAVGPILQGLNKPVNDLSRGCNADDVYKLALITAAQAL